MSDWASWRNRWPDTDTGTDAFAYATIELAARNDGQIDFGPGDGAGWPSSAASVQLIDEGV